MHNMPGTTLLDWIENHLKERQISATRFGRQAVGDPRFVLDLRNGRRPRRKTVVRLEAYLAALGCGDGAAATPEVRRGDLPCACPGNGGGKGNSLPDFAALSFQQTERAARGGKAARPLGGEGGRR